MFQPSNLVNKKSNLFVFVLIIVIGLLALPIILPHYLHGAHFIHIVIHVSGVILSIFITTLAFLAYLRQRTKKMMLTTFAFLIFVLAEIITLIDATWPGIYNTSYFTMGEIGHMFILSTLAILAIGVFRND